jgi:4-hydroxy-tetrahydrodipicolinate synthase
MMRQSDFCTARAVFEDENLDFTGADEYKFIFHDKAKDAYRKIISVIDRPLKMIMLSGSPGSGKTALMNKINAELVSQGKRSLYYSDPIFAERNELAKIYHLYSTNKLPSESTKSDVIGAFKSEFKKDSFIILLDEAQLYSESEMETIRLLSDTRIFKFVIALHKITHEDTLAREHFQTRIWENIELKPLKPAELKFLMEKKMLEAGISHVYQMLDDSHYKTICGYTKGNIRESLKFFYRLFDFYDYLENEKPSEIDMKKIKNKHVMMLALEHGYIKAP